MASPDLCVPSKSIPGCPLSAEIWCWSSLILKLCLLPPLKGNELVTSHLPSSPPDTTQRNLDKNYPIWGQRRKIQKQVVERTIPQRVLATASQAIISSQIQPHRQSTKSLFLVLSQAQTKISTTKWPGMCKEHPKNVIILDSRRLTGLGCCVKDFRFIFLIKW